MEIVEMLKYAGFDVYMRKPMFGRATYCYVTDGTKIAYVQWGDNRPGVSTVHYPNQATGTGYQFSDVISPETVREAMNTVVPHWASGRDVASVRKYKDWGTFHNSDAWHAKMFKA